MPRDRPEQGPAHQTHREHPVHPGRLALPWAREEVRRAPQSPPGSEEPRPAPQEDSHPVRARLRAVKLRADNHRRR